MTSTRVKLITKITPADLADYINRRLTTKDIAKTYGVSPRYVTRVLPKRAYSNQKEYRAKLRENRKNFRRNIAQQVLAKTITLDKAIEIAHCSLSTMRRHMKAVKNA